MSKPPRIRLSLFFLLLGLGFATSAGATLLGQEITVEFISPNDGIDLSQSVTVIGAPVFGEILPSDGSAIGDLLLSTEFVDLTDEFGDPAILLGLEEGAPGGFTGYGDTAHFTFRNLYAGQPEFIESVSVSANDITGITPATVDFSGSRVDIFIDDLVIAEMPGINTGTIAVFLTLGVPEPASAGLLGLGLAGLAAARRRRA